MHLSRTRIRELDSFRGVAALIVVFHHLFTRMPSLFENASNNLFNIFEFISNLNLLAVLFFFFLSGFSIRLSLTDALNVDKKMINDYLYRRFKRILPLYFICLLFTITIGVILNQISLPDYNLLNFIGNVLFLQTSKAYSGYWFSPYGYNGPLWSLSFEMFYYLFFPFFTVMIIKGFDKLKLKLDINKMMLVISFLISILCIGLNKIIFIPYIAFLTLFFCWYIGFYLASLFIDDKLRFDISYLLFSVLTLLLVAINNYIDSSSIGKLLSGSIIGFIFYNLLLIKKQIFNLIRIPRYFLNYFFYRAGRGSYAMYLMHFPIILILMKLNVQSIWLVIIVMSVLYYLCMKLEEYFLRKKLLFFRVNYIA